MLYALVLDANGNGIGSHAYAEQPSALPTNEFPCTQAQAQTANGWALVNGALVESLAYARTVQIATLGGACGAAITSGFTSSALGSAHTYPSGLTDQANLAANVVSSLLPGLSSTWTTPQLCCDANGVWAYVAHTAAQIQQVGSDGKAAILGYLTKKAILQAEIEAATTVAAVQAIVW